MLFIHQYSCISPQQTFEVVNLEKVYPPVDKKLKSREPGYENIPPGILRRMSKPVRMGIGASFPLLKEDSSLDGIIIGTANAGMEDCFYFLKQIVEYDEGLLTPGNFVQSTPNALAGQVAMLKKNKGYNTTHVHLGLAFENAAIDAMMLTAENSDKKYLLGAVDDISTYNYNINLSEGWYKEDIPANGDLYNTGTSGSVPGEGSTMFLVSGAMEKSKIGLVAVDTIHTTDINIVQQKTRAFLLENAITPEEIDLFISGENGDNKLLPYYLACESSLGKSTTIARYKHLSGEYPTANAMALWLACEFPEQGLFPRHMIKKRGTKNKLQNILIYNCFKKVQHSFMLVNRL